MKTARLIILTLFASAVTNSLTAASALAAPAVIDRLEASVNSALILRSDLAKFRETISLRSQLDPLFSGTSLAAKGAAATDEDIVRFLIDEKLILQEFKVSDAEVEQEINQIQANNHIDRAALKNTLRDQGFSFEDYFELIRISTAKRNLIDRDIRSKVTISDDDVKNYYYNHYAKGAAESLAYKVRIITISQGNYKTPAAARQTAETALLDIKKGEPFEDVARRVSDDATASSGGDLGTLTEDQMSPLIRNALKKLKIGEVSDILAAPGGKLIIVKLLDMTANDSDRFTKMKEEIRNHLAGAEYQRQIQLWLDRQRQTAFIHLFGQQMTEATGSR